MSFARVDGRAVVADFGGGAITSDAGALLLGATDRAVRLVDRFATCFSNGRMPGRLSHDVATLVGQRVFGIAPGYGDLVDHDDLRCDPAAIEALFVQLFLDAHKTPPARITLDLDATDDPIHGQQEGRFFHGYSVGYCCLPLYIFCGDHLLAAKLRRADIDASAGASEEVARIVAQIRARWPRVKVLLRADSGFARDALMAWCEVNRVDFLFGLARPARRVDHIPVGLAGAEDARRANGCGWASRTATGKPRPSSAR